MTDAPKRTWAEPSQYPEEWTATAYNRTELDVEYIRADLHAELVKAADELAEAVMDMTFSDNAIAARAALTAYKQAKEKLNV